MIFSYEELNKWTKDTQITANHVQHGVVQEETQHASKHASENASENTSENASKHASKYASKYASKQAVYASKYASKQASKLEGLLVSIFITAETKIKQANKLASFFRTVNANDMYRVHICLQSFRWVFARKKWRARQ